MIKASDSVVRCGIILAAGEGKRLHPLIHRLRGEIIPKQYVNFIGTRSMLEHTFDRAEKLIPPDRLFTVVSQKHIGHAEVWRQLSNRPRGTVILQPENKETGPGLLLPLMHLYKRYPDSIVVIFPSDHFIVEEDLFMGHVDAACRVVEREPSRLVLLGMEPNEPEPEYGYILPGGEVDHEAPSVLRNVLGFIEKPGPHAAREIVQEGGLWNTMVMAFKAETLVKLVQRIAPALYRSFRRIWNAIGSPAELGVVEKTYQDTEPINFSRGFLEALPLRYPSYLWVLPLQGVFWSDWGSEQRIVSILRKTDYLSRLHGV